MVSARAGLQSAAAAGVDRRRLIDRARHHFPTFEQDRPAAMEIASSHAQYLDGLLTRHLQSFLGDIEPATLELLRDQLQWVELAAARRCWLRATRVTRCT